MKANELRIGNYVMYSSLIQVNGYKIAECEEHPKRFEPITLTEEWLKKLGFTKEVLGFKHWNLDLYFHLDGEFFESDQLPMFIFLKYVHQLQNLYFALTGEELTFKSE